MVKGGQSWINILQAEHGTKLTDSICDFGDSYVSEISENCINEFWRDTFKAWLKILRKQYEVNDIDKKIFSVPIWYNSSITINRRPIYLKKWYERGVKILGDFFQNNTFLSKPEFENKFSLNSICFLKFHSVKTAILHFIKSRKVQIGLSQCYEVYPYIPFHIHILNFRFNGSKQIYQFLNYMEVNPSSILKWNAHYAADIKTPEVFKNCFRITVDSSLQWLQFRILHRILPVGSYLKKIRITADDTCQFCHSDQETLEHVFFTCVKVMPLWTDLAEYILEKSQNAVVFDSYSVIFGKPFTITNMSVNKIILFTKQYIYLNLKQNKNLNFPCLLAFIHSKINIEKYIAKKRNEIDKFILIWNSLRNFEP